MSTDALILAIDQGTTSSRAIVFDARSRIVASAQEEFRQIFPRPGWVEHDPEDIWRTTLSAARAAMQQAEAKGGRVQAIGITNQRETAILWDRRTLKPVCNAIVWQDRRTAARCDALREAGHEAMVTARTGLVLDPYFSATKIAWMLDETAGARDAAARGEIAFGTVDAFLLARLTGGAHATDATNASRTSLYDIHRNTWDDELLALFDAPAGVLPEVRDCIAEYGDTLPEHLGRAVPVLAMIGDQQAASFGQACFDAGEVKATYGTGAFIVAQTGVDAMASTNRLLTTISRRIDGQTNYALEGSIFVAGAAVQWLRDALGVIQTAAETEALARGAAGNGGVYFVPAFTGMGAPYWAADARGALTGLTRGAGRAEIARAALEAVAYQTADLLEAMARDGAPVARLKCDGGMAANDWMLEFLAGVADLPVERPCVLETTALGAAWLAGLGCGIFDSFDAAAKTRRVDRSFEPAMDSAERATLRAGWADAVRRVLS